MTPDRLPLAIFTIVISVLALSLGDAAIKASSAGFGLWQIFVLRSVLLLAVLLAVGLVLWGRRAVVPDTPGWAALRSALLTANWIAYYASLPHLDLPVAAAVYYTSPIWITLFAGLFLGERIGAWGWLAVLIGFVGVLVILRPGFDAFGPASLLPLLAAILYALAMVLTRARCRNDHAFALAFSLNIGFILTGGAALLWLQWTAPAADGFLTRPWTPMGREEWQLMVALGGAILIGSIGAAIAYQNGPAAVVGVFDFTYLGFAVLWGIVFFADIPDMMTTVGIGMICAAGFLSMRARHPPKNRCATSP
ncbi:DMT family transporter [Roseovarius pelagicus]|uniref:DMT family transporter n=1 Tax=Roseovarius pelagicus TaxID=2980108 RepID=A0ABY6D954_9RHOB|nr:DMT family transporter [Roseovarius pelagicus]UXX82630.1 DMT family transporter [Roseovarius pelagicus]